MMWVQSRVRHRRHKLQPTRTRTASIQQFNSKIELQEPKIIPSRGRHKTETTFTEAMLKLAILAFTAQLLSVLLLTSTTPVYMVYATNPLHLTSNNATGNAHEIVRQTYQVAAATANHNAQFKNLVKLGGGAPVQSKFNNQSISSDLSSTSSKSGDIQTTDQKRGLFEKICIGTSNKISVQSNKTDHYQNLVERYRNCTYVIGNLEITWLKDSPDRPLDLTFLESIREITGHLLIAYVDVERIRMPNLQIIRGRDLYLLQRDELAILLLENGLKSLELPNLREILAGSVASINNEKLCHFMTINWDEILNYPYRTVLSFDKDPNSKPKCPECDSSCSGNCWSEGPDMCQKFSKTNCAPQCNAGRCFGSAPRECCHLFCAGGCTGPKQTDCLACKNFYDDGECIQECPPMQKYNPSKFSWEPNPKGKYAYGASCVKECPDHLLRDNGACVRTCPPNKRSSNGECLSCSGPCPKECQGDVIHSGNIKRFVNCTTIEGSISILETSFAGFTEYLPNNSIGAHYEPMHPSALIALKNVREITGFLNIQASHEEFLDLSYLRKLESIGGRQQFDMLYALSVFKTSLRSLNLRSLKRIKSGKVAIQENRNLCFEDIDKWLQANITRSNDLIIGDNGDSNECRRDGLQCHAQCGSGGCWGPGADECLSCNNYKFEDSCVEDCASTTQLLGRSSFDNGNRTCKRCDSECLTGCNGTESSDCFQCRNVKDGPYCLAECPSHKFNNSGTCEECDKGCAGGCTGPSKILGPGGCNLCGKVVLRTPNSISGSYCIRADEPCPEGYYMEYIGSGADGHLKMLSGKPVCRRCHHRCRSCTGMGTHLSVCECAKFVAGEQCEETCPRDYYADSRSRHCHRCSSECNGCYGPTEMDCVACRVYRVFPDGYKPDLSMAVNGKPILNISKQSKVKFNCTAHCPPEKPHRISDSNLLDPYCSENPGNDIVTAAMVSSSSSSFLLLIITLSGIFCVAVYRCKIQEDKTVKLMTQMSGFDDVEPLNQSNVKPNLSSLISIKETELRMGKILGSGYGGTVYQGLWCPEGQDHNKKPVAIKVLRDHGQGNMNKEFLDEAYIMASVKHPNLVSLLAVCETPTQLMLVTPLIPLGCLLEFVCTNKSIIGSKNLLEWSKQIAKGMAYLEERRMVHRDLALRNVLLQTSGKAMISDFGLAKFLDVDKSEYHSGGGRLPIKWLAPECIRERKFTHKSDVWAFGVTVWELLSFGKVPYEDYKPKDVPAAIEKGLRCVQPEGVTVELYKELFSCWFYNPENRPSFKDLAERFAKFARDPERYLTCNTKGIDNWKEQELGRTSETDENVFDEYRPLNDSPQKHSALPDLIATSNNHNYRSEMITFRHHSESEGINNQHVSTPTSRKPSMFQSQHGHQSIDDDIFLSSTNGFFAKPLNASSSKDLNNNNNNSINNNNNICNSGSNNFLPSNTETKYAELPTDGDDYLLPSPCSNEDKFTKLFQATHGECSSRLAPASPSTGDPPHSAGLIGISNAQYFISRTRQNYVSSIGAPTTNASSSHIPHSLV